MNLPSFEEFERLSREYTVVPVYREMLADQETPVSAFRKLTSSPDVALLESIEGGETWGRFSMITLDPSLTFESDGRAVSVGRPDGTERFEDVDPMAKLDELVSEHRCAQLDGLPRMSGGAVGYGSYDLVRRFERLPESAEKDLEIPESRFVFFETVVLFDHQFHTLKIVVNAAPGSDAAAAYERAVARIDQIVSELEAPLPAEEEKPPGQPLRFESTVSRDQFCRAVVQAKEYIRAGDIFQVVLAHRLEAKMTADSFDVYRALRVINPSPYMFYLRFRGLTIVGASPEVLVRREGNRVEVRPIAGTRPRGRSEEEDQRLEEDLLGSEKERSEHVMLVDLGRNDVGRVTDHASVRVTDFMVVERYSHVMHIVSNVHGHAPEERTNAEVLAACFPAGTLSGAPKIRAMEIIEELEPVRRGVYGGAVGYLDFHGNMDTCIAIRTLVMKDGKAYLGVGAGIVADSDPEDEYAETMNKGSAVIRACELAENGLSTFVRTTSKKRLLEVPRRSRGDGA